MKATTEARERAKQKRMEEELEREREKKLEEEKRLYASLNFNYFPCPVLCVWFSKRLDLNYLPLNFS